MDDPASHLTRPLISVLIPTRNEADNIDPLLQRVFDALAEYPHAFEVIVVDAASTDGTSDRVERWTDTHPVRLLPADGRNGLAGDILTAAAAAEGEFVVVMDADLSHPPEALADLLSPVIRGDCDMTIGSRYIPGGGTPGWPLRRRVISRAAALLSWPFVTPHDPLSGFFAVRRERLLHVNPGARGFKIGLEVMAAGEMPPRVMEVPITFVDRVAGESKMGVQQVVAYLYRLAQLSGGAISTKASTRFALTGCMGLIVDVLAFQALYAGGLSLAVAHMLSFALALAFNFVLNHRWAFTAHSGRTPMRPRLISDFLAVSLLALALRGGVLAASVQGLHLPAQVAVILAIGVAAVVNYVGMAFFVFPNAKMAAQREWRWSAAAIGVVGYVMLLRLLYVGEIDLLPEEAYYWNYAKHLDIGYLDHPPMVAWLIALTTSILGDTEFAVRLAASFCWLIAAGFVFGLTRNLYGKLAGIRAVLLFASLPFFFAVGAIMTPDAPLVAAWAGALYFLERALRGGRTRAWLGVGCCIGLGMLSKYTIVLLGPAGLVYLLSDPRSRRWLAHPAPYLAAVAALALFTPVIVWNARNGWASFNFQGARRLNAVPEFGLPTLLGYAVLLLTPLGLVGMCRALFARGAVGSDTRRFSLVFTLTPLAVFVAFSLRHDVKLNWTGPIFLAALPALAAALGRVNLTALRPPRLRGDFAWQATIVGCLLVYGLGMHYLTLGLPGLAYPKNLRLPVGWSELGAEVAELDERLEEETGRECLLIGLDRYFTTSQLAFYDREDGVAEAAGRHFVGGQSLMYAHWFDPADHAGEPAVLVSFHADDLVGPTIDERFLRLRPVEQRWITRDGRVVGSYFCRLAYGYVPPKG